MFQLIQASIRLALDVDHQTVTVDRATLPPFLTSLTVRELELPFGRVDLHFERHALDVAVTVLQKQGSFAVQVNK